MPQVTEQSQDGYLVSTENVSIRERCGPMLTNIIAQEYQSFSPTQLSIPRQEPYCCRGADHVLFAISYIYYVKSDVLRIHLGLHSRSVTSLNV